MTLEPAPRAPLLVFAWGNPSRGDDAIGPAFIERMATRLGTDAHLHVELLTDYQLQVEHALDLVDRRRVLFVDASIDCKAPFQVSTLRAGPDAEITTHAMSPQGLLRVYRQLHQVDAPPSHLLAVRGESFELGAPLSTRATSNLDAAVEWAVAWIDA